MYARAAAWLLLLALLSCAPARTESRRAPSPAPQTTAAAATATPTPVAQTAPPRNDAPNPKQKLTVLFLEDETGIGYAALRDDATGQQARYAPMGKKGAFDGAEKYHRDVWSPDGEYLVLPLGPFDGYCVIKAKGALRTVNQRRCDDFIRVLDYRPEMDVKKVAFHHDWNGWETGSAFSFRAGLSDYEHTFVYDAASRRLYDGGPAKGEYLSYLKERVARNEARAVGEGPRGRVEIVEIFSKP